MMTLTQGLQGALLLAGGRADGIEHVAWDREGAARSFWALALCLPAFLFLRLLDWAWTGMPTHPGHATALQLLAYVTGWLGFAVLSRPMAAALGREERWPLFIAAWNWCNVVQYLLLVAAAIPRLLGAPEWLDETVGLVAVFWAIWLEWYATRLALDLSRLPAAAMVMVDILLGIGLSAVVASLT
ncbi:MAG TPA: YIP1 family protein [Acetobacteraceae bacterium]|nr:YIP1 family protein [Acetobacteraceae bacterium]